MQSDLHNSSISITTVNKPLLRKDTTLNICSFSRDWKPLFIYVSDKTLNMTRNTPDRSLFFSSNLCWDSIVFDEWIMNDLSQTPLIRIDQKWHFPTWEFALWCSFSSCLFYDYGVWGTVDNVIKTLLQQVLAIKKKIHPTGQKKPKPFYAKKSWIIFVPSDWELMAIWTSFYLDLL